MASKWPEFLVGPEKLREYYVHIAASNPDPHWANGVEACDRWLDLQRREAVTQSDVDAVLDRLHTETKHGSAWSIMLDQFTCWAKERGFSI